MCGNIDNERDIKGVRRDIQALGKKGSSVITQKPQCLGCVYAGSVRAVGSSASAILT